MLGLFVWACFIFLELLASDVSWHCELNLVEEDGEKTMIRMQAEWIKRYDI